MSRHSISSTLFIFHLFVFNISWSLYNFFSFLPFLCLSFHVVSMFLCEKKADPFSRRHIIPIAFASVFSHRNPMKWICELRFANGVQRKIIYTWLEFKTSTDFSWTHLMWKIYESPVEIHIPIPFVCNNILLLGLTLSLVQVFFSFALSLSLSISMFLLLSKKWNFSSTWWEKMWLIYTNKCYS